MYLVMCAFGQPGCQIGADAVTGEMICLDSGNDLIGAMAGVITNDSYVTMSRVVANNRNMNEQVLDNFARVVSLCSEGATLNNNNNTFTWSGPSGVLGFTGQRRIAPAAGWCMPRRRLSRCAIEPAELPGGGKPPRRKKITTQVLEGLPLATHVSVCPEPPPGRKLPALLAVFRVAIGCEACASSVGFVLLVP
jgi:hypothetical protein